MSATLAKFGALLMSATLAKFDALPATTFVVRTAGDRSRRRGVGLIRTVVIIQPHPTRGSPGLALLAVLKIHFPRVCRGPLVAAGSTLEASKALVQREVLPQDPLTACAWKGRLAGDGYLLFLCTCANGLRVHALGMLCQ